MRKRLLVLLAVILVSGTVQFIGVSSGYAQDLWFEHPWCTQQVTDGDTVYVFYLQYFNTAYTDPIRLFDPPGPGIPVPIDTTDMHVRKAVDSENDVHIVWQRKHTVGNWMIFYAEITPTDVLKVGPVRISDVLSTDSKYPAIALDSNDDAHVVWVDDRGPTWEIYYSKIQDDTGTDLTVPTDWLLSMPGFNSGRVTAGDVDDGTTTLYIEHPDIAVDSQDSVHVVWSDARDLAAWEIYYQKQDNSAIPITTIDDLRISANDNEVSQCPAIAIGEGNTVHIVWQDARDAADWEVYYQQQNLLGVIVDDVRRSGPDDGYNSAMPDIDVENGPGNDVHIVFMDQRLQDPGLSASYHIPDQWEIYTTILYANGNTDGYGVPKRQSDIWGAGVYGPYYSGPPDGHSMYPQIAVEDHHYNGETYIKWHDERDGNWEIYESSVHNWCNNPMTDVRVTNNPAADMYPSIALDSITKEYERNPDNKWQSDRDGTWSIYNARKADDQWVHFHITGSDTVTYDMYPYPGDIDPVDGIWYTYGLPIADPQNFEFGFSARDPFGHTYSIGYYEPTFVQLASFAATRFDDRIEITWTTATEINNAGFNLYRGLSEYGERTKVNKELIPGTGDALSGASYSFIDREVASGVTYYYWFEDMDLSGKGTVQGPIMVSGEEEPTPAVFNLAQNYPNPFNPYTEIKYELPVACHVNLEIYNVLGQKVATLVNEYQDAGDRAVRWYGQDDKGMTVSSGVYFYKLRAGSYSEIRKMVLLR
ncbi:MAG: T9SS type A sorting domain-containing protein [bacterium]|nr:MAG: T9SS type A sorting domain-containing protein [bacterium]